MADINIYDPTNAAPYDPSTQGAGTNPSNPQGLTISPDTVKAFYNNLTGGTMDDATAASLLKQYGNDWGAITDAINAMYPGAPVNSGLPNARQPLPSGGSQGAALPAYPQTIAPFSGVNYPQFTPPPLPASLQQQFQLPTAADLRANDPGYDARFNQGLIANERSAAAQGSLLSGGTQQALNRYGQDYASNEYNNYVNQQLQARQQQASDYLTLAYGPAWQQNQAAVGQYNNLYGQYSDLIANNRNAQNDYINALLGGMNIGVGAGRSTAPTPISPSTVGTGL